MSMAEAEPPPAMKPSEEAGWQLPQVPQLQHPNEVRSRPSPHHRAPIQLKKKHNQGSNPLAAGFVP
jgi:hypothetical protein